VKVDLLLKGRGGVSGGDREALSRGAQDEAMRQMRGDNRRLSNGVKKSTRGRGYNSGASNEEIR